ncbi:MAG: helix-turn-helix transcriptional regulator [Azonexus sp.]|nr:helix-turn-helix transcriptional regulator [Azonexus sp.]
MNFAQKCRDNRSGDLNLRELRRAKGVSQVDLADRLQVTQPHVAKLESQKDMHVQTLQRYVAALGGNLELIVRFPRGRFGIRLERPDGKTAVSPVAEAASDGVPVQSGSQ